MAINIKSLLRKKHLTGEEIGKAIIVSVINDIKNAGNPHNPLFSQADLEKMENSLNTEKDCLIYGVYRDLYHSILECFNTGVGIYQQFYHGYTCLMSHIKDLRKADEAKDAIAMSPLILTEKQYKRLEREAHEKLCSRTECYSSLMVNILSSILEILESNEPSSTKFPKEIIDAIEVTKKEPAVSEKYLKLYNSTYKIGYCTTPDGKKSKLTTYDEWVKVVRTERIFHTQDHNIAGLMRYYELYFKGAEAIREAYIEATGQGLIATDDEILKAMEEIITAVGQSATAQALEKAFDNNCKTWHYETESPKNLTKYDLIHVYIQNNRGAQQPLKDLESDYPDLYKILRKYIEETIPLHKNTLTWKELADLGALNYKKYIIPTDHHIIGLFNDSRNYKINHGSIAIIHSPLKSQTDNEGNYIAHKNPLTFFETIESLAEDKTTIADIKTCITGLISPALSYLYASNALMKILAEVYDVPELEEEVCHDTKAFENQVENYNKALYALYALPHGSEEERKKTRRKIKDIFAPLETLPLKPSKETINLVATKITQLGVTPSSARGALKHLDGFINQLMGEWVV